MMFPYIRVQKANIVACRCFLGYLEFYINLDPYLYLYLYVCIEKGLSSGSSSPKWMQQLVLSQADASNQEFHPSLPHGWQSPNTCVNLHCLLQALSREVDGKQSSQDVNQHPYGMLGVADSSLILCAANMGSLNANLNCSYFVSYPAPCSCFW